MSRSTKSCPLAGFRVEAMWLVGPTQLLSDPFQAGVRLLPHPGPAAPWAFLANTLSAPVEYGVGGLRAFQLVLTSCPAFLAPDHLVLLAVAVSALALTAGLATEATLSHGLQTPLPAVVENP
jgi:hypothetical protein